MHDALQERSPVEVPRHKQPASGGLGTRLHVFHGHGDLLAMPIAEGVVPHEHHPSASDNSGRGGGGRGGEKGRCGQSRQFGVTRARLAVRHSLARSDAAFLRFRPMSMCGRKRARKWLTQLLALAFAPRRRRPATGGAQPAAASGIPPPPPPVTPRAQPERTRAHADGCEASTRRR